MELCAGQYRYLLSIYRLQKERRRIRCVDIANDLGVTRPSVSKMMKCMVRMELVEPDYCEAVRLTHRGWELAEHYSGDYDMVYAFFRRILRLSPTESKEQTLLFLSVFPKSTVQRLSTMTARSIEIAAKKRSTAKETNDPS
jgi:Mn-dependent DtxR family transcriptional regulator